MTVARVVPFFAVKDMEKSLDPAITLTTSRTTTGARRWIGFDANGHLNVDVIANRRQGAYTQECVQLRESVQHEDGVQAEPG